MKTKKLVLWAVLVVISAAAIPANAAVVVVSDQVLYGGAAFNFVEINEPQPPLNLGTITWPVPIPDQVVFLTEPGVPPTSLDFISDRAYIVHETVFFQSDPFTESLPSNILVAQQLEETGLFQDVGIYFRDAAGQPIFPPGFFQVASDVEAAVPEPLTVAVWAIGGVLALRFRRPLLNALTG